MSGRRGRGGKEWEIRHMEKCEEGGKRRGEE